MDRLDPIGEWRKDFHMAQLATLITNLAIAIHYKKGTKQASITDFMPDWDKEPEGDRIQSAEEMKAILMQLVASTDKKATKTKK